MVEALVAGINVEVLAGRNVNVSADMITALEFPMPMSEEDLSC